MIGYFKRKAVFFGILLCLFLITVGCFVFLTKEVGNIGYSEAKIRYQNLPINNWQKFSSAEGKFSVLFPGIPVTTNSFMHFLTNSAEAHLFYVNYNIQNGFGVIYMDISGYTGWAQKTNAQDTLEKMQSYTVSQQAGKIVFQQESEFEGYPTREFECAAGGKANYSARYKLILTGRYVYVVYVVFLTANPHPADRTIFFNSFSLN